MSINVLIKSVVGKLNILDRNRKLVSGSVVSSQYVPH